MPMIPWKQNTPRAEWLGTQIDSLVDTQYPDGVPVWQIMALAVAIGPFRVSVDYPMLRICFIADGSDITITPDDE